jgi:hypothetical protein
MTAPSTSKGKTYAAIALAVVAVLTILWQLRAQPGPVAPVVATEHKHAEAVPADALDPRLHLDLLVASESVRYEGTGRNIFHATDEPLPIEKVKISPLKKAQLAQQAQQEAAVRAIPVAPPITLKFFGISKANGEKTRGFFSQGGDVWIAHEGDVVNRHYRIARINNRDAEVEDLMTNHKENIPLAQGLER